MERPILFSTPMVKAILEGRKTQTRRVMKMSRRNDMFCGLSNDPDTSWPADYPFGALMGRAFYDNEAVKCPYGKVGNVLWVRESWNVEQYPVAPEGDRDELLYFYRATERVYTDMKWRPSIHMPKAAARIFLEITDIRVERLREISDKDAFAEGIQAVVNAGQQDDGTARGAFKTLWQSINGEESWQGNPWVWCITFKILSTTGKP